MMPIMQAICVISCVNMVKSAMLSTSLIPIRIILEYLQASNGALRFERKNMPKLGVDWKPMLPVV